MVGKIWSQEEIQIVKNNYEKIILDEMQELLPTRTRTAIKLMGRRLGLSSTNKVWRESDLSILLNETLESNYWIGFLLADGSIFNNKRLKFALADKDKDQVIRFADYIGCKNWHENIKHGKYSYCYVSAQDNEIVPKLTDRFDIKQNKTYDPPRVSVFDNLSDDCFLSLFVGFVDGDGCIQNIAGKRKDVGLQIKNHGSWIKVLAYFEKRLWKISKIEKRQSKGLSAKINSFGYASIYFGDSRLMKFLRS